MNESRRAWFAALVVLSLTLTTEGKAMGIGFVAVSIDGPAPQTMPVPGLPTGFMEAGQVLDDGSEYLMIKGTTLILVHDQARQVVTLEGPIRFEVRGQELKTGEPAQVSRHEPGYFADPKMAVDATARWLRGEDWVKLALHYDLAGTDIPLSSLCTGAFFVREKPPEVGHPGGFSRFKQPFAPSFAYESHHSLEDGTIRVTVQISIDQGGGMVQEGRDTFNLRRSAKGLQLLPKTPDAPGEASPALPAPAGSGPGSLPTE